MGKEFCCHLTGKEAEGWEGDLHVVTKPVAWQVVSGGEEYFHATQGIWKQVSWF